MFRWAKSPWRHPESILFPWKLIRPSMKIHWNQGNFHGWAQEFGGKRIDSGSLQWAFRSANHGWKSFLTLNSFPAHMRYFKNLKSTWHKILSCSCQLQTIFWSLTPHLHVLIMIWNVYVSQKDGVLYAMVIVTDLKLDLIRMRSWTPTLGTWALLFLFIQRSFAS